MEATLSGFPKAQLVSRSEDKAASPKTRACSHCARLKMKCQWPLAGAGLSGSSCARCSRMKLPCHVPLLAPRKKRGKGTRVAQLEQKIDGLVSLLAAGQHLQASGSSPPTPKSQESAQVNSQTIQENVKSQPEERPNPIPMNAIADGGTTAYELTPGFQLTSAQAKTYLYVFRRDYAPRFPFVMISPQTTPQELFSKEVCLFWAIMSTVAPLPADTQLAVKDKIRATIADHVIGRKEKRLGHLQAILVYLAWSEFQVFFESNATSLLSLAHSLVIDLKLDKSAKAMTLPPRTLLRDAWDTFKYPTVRLRPELSLEEKRALLGYYHQSSIVAELYRRGQALPWTAHVTQCCESLVEASEFQSDLQIVAIVNIQRIFDRALSSLAASSSSDLVYSDPLDMALNNVRREVEDLMSRQPKVVQDDKILHLFRCSLFLRLYEPVIAMHPGSLVISSAFSPGPLPRTDCMWRAVQASKDLLNTYLEIPPAELSFMPSTSVSLYAFGNVVTSRLLTADISPDWDPAIARRSFDYVVYLTRISEQYETADRLAEENGWRRRVLDNGMVSFSKFAGKMQWILQWYISRVDPEQLGTQSVTADGVNAPAAADQSWADVSFENTWQDLMSFHDPSLFHNFGFDAF